ncbi:serine/threonine-protein kinase [Propionibacteriaceae bacterium Y2011]|uniref:serine/threonine-protein kinase n=1 Tax=Microlunatus sp. Y2014 TaxID=3418488 RepID=UPI003B478D4D
MDKIGRYRLTGRLGAGSFATVWKGHDDDLDVPVAVKVLADNWSDNEDVRNRFLTEARIMRKIRDGRIVRVYDIGSLDDGRPYFVMDFADGGSLEDLRKQGIPPQLALRLCAEASRALHVLHSNDIIHRDVTPGNVLLHKSKDGGVNVLIADLGVAKSMVDLVGATMTAGTPAYMALEQATGVGTLDHRADIYSLAAVTYAMLTGRPPFPVRTLADLLARDPNAKAEPIAEAIGAPPMLDAVLQSSLAPQPGLRPRTALQLGNALDEVADQLRSGSQGSGPSFGGGTGGTGGSSSPGSLAPASQATWQAAQHTSVTGGNVPPTFGATTDPFAGGGSPFGASQYGSSQAGASQYGGSQYEASPFGASQYGSSPHGGAPQGLPEPSSGEERQGRSMWFYILVLVSALALFTVSLLITIVALSG